MVCSECGKIEKLVAKGMCSKCYKRKGRELQARLKLKARLEAMVETVKILNIPVPATGDGIPPLTPFEEYVGKRGSIETIGSISQNTGRSMEDVRIAYEHYIWVMSNASLQDMPMLCRKYGIPLLPRKSKKMRKRRCH